MGKTVDERVVQMKFDNRQFEQGVSKTMSTLDKFKQKLNLTGASKGLDDVQKSAQNLNKNMSFDNAEKSLASLEKRFSTLGIVGMTVIQNLTNSMMNFAKKVGDYGIGGIIEGGKSRAMKIENAKFQIKGLIGQVEDAQQRLDAIMDDVNYGFWLAKEMGRLDVGQSVVIKDKMIMAVEALEGTDECIKRGSKLAKSGAVVVKVAKPNQDKRFDIPAIGMRTLKGMHRRKTSLIAVEANETIIVDQEKVIEYANRHNIVIMAV